NLLLFSCDSIDGNGVSSTSESSRPVLEGHFDTIAA
ncbi:hypothetical protein Tco_1545200, partial [Tanacetum coccineum]